MEKLRITLDELPLRARKLSECELTNVFGGCIGPLGHCSNYCDCCSMACDPTYSGGQFLGNYCG
jgi:hypothetical protein